MAMATFLSAVAQAADEPVTLVSTELAGGQFSLKDGRETGFFADFFREASERSQIPIKFRLVPWKRAVREVEKYDNLLIFPLTRTEKREDRFSWITPLMVEENCFISGSGSIDSLTEARTLNRIVVRRGSSMETYIREQNFPRIFVANDLPSIISILKKEKKSAWYTFCDAIRSFADSPQQPSFATAGKPIGREDIWLASGINYSPTPSLRAFVAAVTELVNDGVLDKLRSENRRQNAR